MVFFTRSGCDVVNGARKEAAANGKDPGLVICAHELDCDGSRCVFVDPVEAPGYLGEISELYDPAVELVDLEQEDQVSAVQGQHQVGKFYRRLQTWAELNGRG